MFVICSIINPIPHLQHFAARMQRDKPSHTFRTMQSTTKDVDVDTWPEPTIVSNQLINFNDPILPTRFVKLYWRINQELVGSRDPWLIDKLKAELSGMRLRLCAAFSK